MTSADLKKIDDRRLAERFRDAARAKSAALLDSDTRLANQLFDEMTAIDNELRSRGQAARRALLVLLDDGDLRVRLEAAQCSLAVDPERALATIKDVAASHKMPEAGEAGMALLALEQGIFKPT